MLKLLQNCYKPVTKMLQNFGVSATNRPFYAHNSLSVRELSVKKGYRGLLKVVKIAGGCDFEKFFFTFFKPCSNLC